MVRKLIATTGCCLVIGLVCGQVFGQSMTQASTDAAVTQQQTQVVVPQNREAAKVAGRANLYCAGFIKYQRFGPLAEIVGAENEPEARTFAEGDIVYLNWGANHGLKEGQQLQIIRPKGDVKGVFREKKGFLGTYVRELGQLEILKVYNETAIAQITFSCEMVLLGDLLQPMPDRQSPLERTAAIDRYAAPSGKPVGRLMMARDGREMVSTNDVVHIDLGSEDRLAPGDYLTIFRALGDGGVTSVDAEEDARGRATGFQSEAYRGGGFSSQSQRAKDSTAFVNVPGRYRYRPQTTREVKNHRPEMPRKVVGEMVVIDVQARTATAIITRVVQEAHTGDWVEIQ